MNTITLDEVRRNMEAYALGVCRLGELAHDNIYAVDEPLDMVEEHTTTREVGIVEDIPIIEPPKRSPLPKNRTMWYPEEVRLIKKRTRTILVVRDAVVGSVHHKTWYMKAQ